MYIILVTFIAETLASLFSYFSFFKPNNFTTKMGRLNNRLNSSAMLLCITMKLKTENSRDFNFSQQAFFFLSFFFCFISFVCLFSVFQQVT